MNDIFQLRGLHSGNPPICGKGSCLSYNKKKTMSKRQPKTKTLM